MIRVKLLIIYWFFCDFRSCKWDSLRKLPDQVWIWLESNSWWLFTREPDVGRNGNKFSEKKKKYKIWFSIGTIFLKMIFPKWDWWKSENKWNDRTNWEEKTSFLYLLSLLYFPSFSWFILLVVGSANRFRLILIVAWQVDAMSSEVWLDSFTREHVSPQD